MGRKSQKVSCDYTTVMAAAFFDKFLATGHMSQKMRYENTTVMRAAIFDKILATGCMPQKVRYEYTTIFMAAAIFDKFLATLIINMKKFPTISPLIPNPNLNFPNLFYMNLFANPGQTFFISTSFHHVEHSPIKS